MTVDPLEAALGEAEEIELITTGRRSGTPHAVTVWFAYDDGSLWLRTDRDADWYRNLERDPRARVRVAGREFEVVRAAVADEEAALRRLVDLWRDKYGQEWVGDWYVERGRVPVRLRPIPDGRL